MTADLDAQLERNSGTRRDVLVSLLLFAAIIGLGIAVAWPWRAFYRSSNNALSRYAPTYDGWSALNAKLGADGSVTVWHSINRRQLRNSEGYATELSKAARESIIKLYDKDATPGSVDFVALTRGAQFIQERVTELDATGVATQTTSLVLRNAGGEYLVSLNADAPDKEITFSPPGLFIPADLRAGKTWESAGALGGAGAYTITGVLAPSDPYHTELGQSDDCVQVKLRFRVAVGGQVTSDRQLGDRLCAGLGMVEEVEADAGGVILSSWRTLSTSVTGTGVLAEHLPPPAEAKAGADTAGMQPRPDTWVLTRIGRTAAGINVSPTIPPVYLAIVPSVLLVATYEGDLVALDAASAGPDPLWRFDPTGTVFGQPAFDAERGRIYFGASDKRLYALDRRGLFLWTFATGDNVATRPVIASDLVIFGSEDRNAYAVEADTGKLRWRQNLGGALVAAPAVADVTIDGAERRVVVFGSDEGAVSGLDAVTGEPLWQYDAGKAVEAPIVVDGDTAFVATTGGAVAALSATTGEEQWTADLTSTHVVRSAPAVTPERVYVVDELGYLTALAREDGRRIWQSRETDYYGAPLVVGSGAGEEVIVGDAAGVARVGADGVRRASWSLAASGDASDPAPRADFGPVAGGDGFWLSDRRSAVWRIGLPRPGPQALPLAWNTPVSEPPFALDIVRATPVRQGDRLLALDESGRLYRIDPLTGAAELAAKTANELVFVEPLVVGDLLITASNKGLMASRLSDGGTAWHVDGGAVYQPPVLAGDLVLWLSTAGGETVGVRVAAVDVRSGAVRWEHSFPAVTFAGGLAAAGDAIYVSSPPASLDLQTGAERWQSTDVTNALGAPALSPDGKTVYLGAITPLGGAFYALNAADGSMRWQQSELGSALNLLERPWVSGDVLVVPTLGGGIIGLNAADGTLRWTSQLPGTRFGGITVEGGRIYTALLDGQMVILKADNGEIIARRGDREGGLETYARAQRPVVLGEGMIMSFGSALRGYRLPDATARGVQ